MNLDRQFVSSVIVLLFAVAPASAQVRPSGGLTIQNSHQIDAEGRVVRGAAPARRVRELPAEGITDVLIIKNQTRNEVDSEIQALRQLGYSPDRITHIPMRWRDANVTEGCQQTIQALKLILDVSARRGRRIYFHCTVGEDRTGMVSGFYRMLTQGWTLERAFEEEMCARGYAEGNRAKPAQVTADIRRNLTPLVLTLGGLIESRRITATNLDERLCVSPQYQALLQSPRIVERVRTLRCRSSMPH